MGKKENNLKYIDIEAMRRGPQVTRAQGDTLTAPVTKEVIMKTSKGLGDLKSPGMDGFGAKNSKSSWQTIKIDVIVVVQDLFEKGNLLKAFKSTIATLISKSENPTAIKDCWPIAVCTTFYKIMSKILTNRMSLVLKEIIHQSQLAFLSGQAIYNHILLAFELMKGYTRKGGTPRCMMQLDLQNAYDMVN